MISKNRWLGAAAVVAVSTLAQPALAQARSFNIPAQDVTGAVRLFARQGGVQILVAGSVGAGHRTNAVAGKLPVDEALQQMLARTGLAARTTGSNRYVIVAEERPAETSQATPPEQVPGEIVVTGFRASQREAVAEKRAADNVIETLHANDVGKLPDQNVAEAIKRLRGLSVANDQGEGRYAIIRGIDPALLNVTLNGQTLPAPEAGSRQVKLDDLPSAMIQSVAVSKSLLASQDANAIAGEVAIRTRSAFDSAKPFFLDARAAQGWYSLNHKVPYELDGTIGGKFGKNQQFGAVVSVNYSQRPIESQNYQGSSAWNSTGVPDGNGLRDYNLTRTRLGVVGNFDWRPSETVKLYVRSSYSQYKDHETRDQNRLAVTTYGTTLKGTGTILVRNRNEDDNTKSVTLGGEFAEVAGGTLEASGNWTRAEKRDPLRSEFTFTTSKGGLTLDYDPSTYPYTLTPTTAAFATPSLFTYSKVNFDTRFTYEALWQGRIDYSHPIAFGDDSSIKLGGKYLTREKFNDQNKLNYGTGTTKWTLDGSVASVGATDFYDGMFGFGERINYANALAYFNANPAVAKLNTTTSISDSLSNDSDVREKIAAGYVMATLKFGGLTLVPGVRVEHTEDDVKAKVVNANSTLTDGYNSFGHTSYTDLFPGVNAKFDLGHHLLLRGAVTTSIGRPNYSNLAPYVVVDTSGTVPAISLGNPDLKPYRAVNYDAAIEFYPAPGAILSAGVFHKDIDNPIYSTTSRQTNVTEASITYASADVTSLINAQSETLTGVEANAQFQFTFLPGLLSGFGVSANYTHVSGHATAPSVRGGNLPLLYQSNDLGNVQIFFEKYGLSARAAFNYRSAYLDTLGTSAATDQYTDGNGQLDVHVSYQVTPQFTLFGDAINLTDAPWRRYIGTKNQLVERERYGTQLRGGVQIHF